nr:hypothetical protein [Streptomyces sp. SID8359]
MDSVILGPAWHGLGLGPVLAGTAKLARVWSTVGFEPFQHGVHFLACHLQRPLDLLAEHQQEFTAPCRSWSAQHGPQ